MSQHTLYEYLKNKNPLELLIVADAKEAKESEAAALHAGVEPILFPDFRAAFGDDLRVYTEEIFALFDALRLYHQAKKKPLVISPLKTLLFHFPKKELLQSFKLEFAQKLELKPLKEQLLFWGYAFVDIVQMAGEVSFRGDIIDIFSPNKSLPLRLSLFDNEVEQIKEFEPESQRTLGDELAEVEIVAPSYSLDENSYNSLMQKAKNSEFDSLSKDIASLGLWLLDEMGESFLSGKNAKLIHDLDATLIDAYALNKPTLNRAEFNLAILPEAQQYKEIAPNDPKALISLHKDKKITLIAANEALIKQAGLYEETKIKICYAPYVLNLVSPDELIISLNKKERQRRRRVSSILLDDLKIGDYVVHEEYGVGIFEGIEKLDILGGVKDFILIKYVGDDKILLPVENLDYIDRYIASGGSTPQLDKLGKGGFSKLKESVKKRLMEIAGEIVNTAAARELVSAPKIAIAKNELQEFQKLLGYNYTPDQTTAINEILEQVGSGRIMDRLLSGDVGFGKTEVAMNTIFAAAKSGFQSALIVPTTLLSAQHYRSLSQRFNDLGIRVAKLDRFVSTKDKTNITKALAQGIIDVVVGTHALFELEFKNLGVVIIDEEHKFGVKQKEKIKELYHSVHILSMSATPIPRSLNQALSSIKTMSTLTTPPSEREGVRTFVKEYDEGLIKEVILRELRRGGQIFYIHNSIDHMPIKLGELKAILPDLRIVMLHSQISAAETEKELLKFENHEYDLMLATSIIESGIHMPRVNTILVDGADRFGMADLHQLRGRVGRGRVEGFAYFVVNDKEALTDEAKKRLLVLESNSSLGSGAVLAYHDLEIRGGGNLVGDAQSGHIKNIGYSLYLKMLEDAIRTLSNQQLGKKAKIDIKLTVNAYISEDIVSEERLRLDLYRRLSSCESVNDIYEIQDEFIDRFKTIDAPSRQFFDIMAIKLLCISKDIKLISNYAQNITITYIDEKKAAIKSDSKDDDDIIKAVMGYLKE